LLVCREHPKEKIRREKTDLSHMYRVEKKFLYVKEAWRKKL